MAVFMKVVPEDVSTAPLSGLVRTPQLTAVRNISINTKQSNIANSRGQVGTTPVHSPPASHVLIPPLLEVRTYPGVQVYVAMVR